MVINGKHVKEYPKFMGMGASPARSSGSTFNDQENQWTD
jgi:hypothetical protein